jgi:hypothetical protein
MIDTLAECSLEDAQKVATGPHAFTYDNLSLSSSIFVEQAPGAMSKVQSGTFAVLYELLNAKPEDMELEAIMLCLQTASKSPLKMSDLRASIPSVKAYQIQAAANVIRTLTEFVPAFSHYRHHPELQHQPRRQLPPNHKTKFFPLRASTIEEASVKGNILVHDDVYVVQLQRNPNDLNKLAIPALHDQLTNARNWGVQAMRKKDVTPWTRHEVFQLSFGIFHLTMNLIWAILNTHRGTVNQPGSLSQLFMVLEKVRLNAEHPDFHTLLAALTQILDGLILNAWCDECGFPSLDEFSKSKPTPADLLELARKIVQKHATPTATMKPVHKPPKSQTPAAEDESECADDSASHPPLPPPAPLPSGLEDIIHENIVRLIRDLLYIIELVQAVKAGDIGRVEDILPDLACMFRGAGSNNYSTEILHLLFNLKEVWTPEFA